MNRSISEIIDHALIAFRPGVVLVAWSLHDPLVVWPASIVGVLNLALLSRKTLTI